MTENKLSKPSLLKISTMAFIGLFLLFSVYTGTIYALSVADPSARQGMIMSLSPNAGIAEPASDKNSGSLIGILAPPEESLTQQAGEVNIKKDGVTNALVSTLNGDIKVGDRIAATSLVGVGAKAEKSGWIVGIAQGSFDDSTSGAVVNEITLSNGDKKQVRIAQIPVLVNVTYFSAPENINENEANNASVIPDSVQEFADKIADKRVGTLAIILSFILIFAAIFLAGVLIYSSVTGGIAAIARQPLIKGTIMKNVTRTFFFSAGVILGSILAAYLILRFV